MTTTQSNWLKAIYDRMVNIPKFTMEEFYYQCNGGQSFIIFDTKEYEKISDGRGMDNITIINGGNA